MADPELTEAIAAPRPEDPAHTPLIEARLADLLARFGDRLDDQARAQIRGRIAHQVALGAALRRVPLTNADEPEFVFTPYRSPAP